MLNDLYARNPTDPNYIIGQLEMENSLELFKQQIENCLFTSKTMVLGDIEFGASLDEYIWSFNLSASSAIFSDYASKTSYLSSGTSI